MSVRRRLHARGACGTKNAKLEAPASEKSQEGSGTGCPPRIDPDRAVPARSGVGGRGGRRRGRARMPRVSRRDRHGFPSALHERFETSPTVRRR